MTDEEKSEIKNRLSDIGAKVGELALNYIENLEKENKELKKDKEWLDDTNNEQTEVILKLNEQIEKMKCCGNCKHNYFDNEEIRHCDVLNQHQMVVFKKCDKWELAE